MAINNSFSLPAEPVYLPSVKTEGGEVMIQAPLNEAAEPQRVQVRLLLYRDDQTKVHYRINNKELLINIFFFISLVINFSFIITVAVSSLSRPNRTK